MKMFIIFVIAENVQYLRGINLKTLNQLQQILPGESKMLQIILNIKRNMNLVENLVLHLSFL